MSTFREILKKYFQRDRVISASAASPIKDMSQEDIRLLRMVGATYAELTEAVTQSTAINYERTSLYREIERSQEHWMMGAAVDLFADVSTPYSPIQNKSIWVVAQDRKYQYELDKFLDEMELEEKLYDWASTLASYGDLMIKTNGHPGLGLVSIDDSPHPSAISRIDHDGVLLGFYQTPFDTGGMGAEATSDVAELQAPWDYVHFRLLGAVRRRSAYADPSYMEHRTIHLMGSMNKQVTTKYGTSLLFNGLPVYKRLRLAEDALLLARLTRGIQRYIYKIKCDSCLRGNTKISLLNGQTPTIQEMAENKEKYVGLSVMTVDEKTMKPQPNKIKDIYKTRLNAEMLRVYLDNEKYIDCTPDHRFMMRDGSYKEASLLRPADLLMSYVTSPNEDGHKEYPFAVVEIEALVEREDTYDITIENTPNFPVEAGVFLHNSNPEAAGQLVQEYMNILKHARAINTTSGSENFESKSNLMCLRGSAKIRLCDGRDVTIKEIVDNRDDFIGRSVWSINNETLEVEASKITVAEKTRLNARLVRVHLDNNEYVDCTPDHRFMLADGTYVEAQLLDSGDSLMPYDFDLFDPIAVVEVEELAEREDTYDITVEKNHNFSLSCGVFVHNSSMEDLFVPVFGETGDIDIEKIGGEVDIKWICLRGSTEVRLLNDTSVPIQTIVENKNDYIGKYVYSCSKEGKILPRKIKDARITKRNASFVRVHLDNEKYFDVTPDHRCMLRDGSFLEAEKLVPGQSLMPLYTKRVDLDGRPCYERVYNPGTHGWPQTHTLVANIVLNKERIAAEKEYLEDKNESYLVIHHKNFNKYDNDPSNLCWQGDSSHRQYHVECRWSGLSAEERRVWVIENVISKRKSIRHKENCGCLLCLSKQGKYKTFDITKQVICKYCGEDLGLVSYAQYANHVQWNCFGHDRTVRKPVSDETRAKRKERAKDRIWVCSEQLGKETLIKKSKLDEFLLEGWSPGRFPMSEETKVKKSESGKGRIRIYSEQLQKEKFVKENELPWFLDSGWLRGKSERPVKLNHKVVKVERLDVIEDAYDLTIDGEEHTFAVSAGVFVHNCDIEELRNQLACSLRVPLSLLGGYIQEASGSLGSEAIEQLDVRFSRAARRLQRGITTGVRRLCQIHLAYMGMDPDPKLFDVYMGDTNSAEEKLLKESLETAVDVVDKVIGVIEKTGVELDKPALFDYLNKKVIKLNDFDLKKFIKEYEPEKKKELMGDEEPQEGKEMTFGEGLPPGQAEEPFDFAPTTTADEETPIVVDSLRREFFTYLPLNDNVNSRLSNLNEAAWNSLYKGKKVEIIEEKNYGRRR